MELESIEIDAEGGSIPEDRPEPEKPEKPEKNKKKVAAVQAAEALGPDKKVVSWKKTVLKEMSDAASVVMVLEGTHLSEGIIDGINQHLKLVKDGYNRVIGMQRRGDHDQAYTDCFGLVVLSRQSFKCDVSFMG